MVAKFSNEYLFDQCLAIFISDIVVEFTRTLTLFNESMHKILRSAYCIITICKMFLELLSLLEKCSRTPVVLE